MKMIAFEQGSQEWLDWRNTGLSASDAPAMMGVSKYKKRDDLIAEHATGIKEEVDEFTQRLFQKGHNAEASIRPHIEKLVDQELFPLCGENDEYGLHLLASMDGQTMDGDLIFEHKLWNEKKLAEMEITGNPPETDYWQIVHQFAVSGAISCIYVISDGAPDKCRHILVNRNESDVKKLVNGWLQFIEDVSSYEPPKTVQAELVPAAVKLPVLRYEVNGTAVESNIDSCIEITRDLAEKEKTKALETDQDFADKDKLTKDVKKARELISLAIVNVRNRFTSFSDFSCAVEQLDSILQKLQSHSEKLVKSEKERRKAEIVTRHKEKVRDHIAKLNTQLDGNYMDLLDLDIAGKIKGLKSLSSMEERASNEANRVIVDSAQKFDELKTKLDLINSKAEYEFLFSDKQDLIAKSADHLEMLIEKRIQDYEAAAVKSSTEAADKAVEAHIEPIVGSLDAGRSLAGVAVDVMNKTGSRPSDAAIIEVLSIHYRADQAVIIEWLMNMDLLGESKKLASNS